MNNKIHACGIQRLNIVCKVDLIHYYHTTFQWDILQQRIEMLRSSLQQNHIPTDGERICLRFPDSTKVDIVIDPSLSGKVNIPDMYHGY